MSYELQILERFWTFDTIFINKLALYAYLGNKYI